MCLQVVIQGAKLLHRLIDPQGPLYSWQQKHVTRIANVTFSAVEQVEAKKAHTTQLGNIQIALFNHCHLLVILNLSKTYIHMYDHARSLAWEHGLQKLGPRRIGRASFAALQCCNAMVWLVL